jgi:hypothetical protein
MILRKHVTDEDFNFIKVTNPKKKEELKRLAELLIETDNPVLIIVKIKINTDLNI